MTKVPKKNISPFLSDIRQPGKKIPYQPANLCRQTFSFKKTAEEKPYKILLKRRNSFSFPKIVLAFFGVVVLISLAGGSLIFAKFSAFKPFISEKIRSIVDNSQEAVSSLNNFDPRKAAVLFDKNNSDIIAVKDLFQNFFLTKIMNLGGFFDKSLSLNQSALAVSRNLEALKTNGLNLFMNGDGKELVKIIKNLREEIDNIQKSTGSIRNQIAAVGEKMDFLKGNLLDFSQIDKIVTEEYFNYGAKLYQTEDVLAGLLDVLQSKNDVHWLIFFQNPAEIRPAGGFLGSYADLTINSGRLANIDVRDIYDPDGQLDLKVVPPMPLQAITVSWEARDANWFFDFPVSARKVTSFLEASKIYQEQNTEFSGVIALNIRILESILEITGPMEIGDYPEINKDNFMREIQREVEAGPDKAAGKPKRILQVLAPALLERINNFNEEQKRELMDKLGFHLTNKDIMLFAEDRRLENFFSQNNLSGEVYKLPDNFYGSYLAVVNANIAGGKSDYFIKQEINLKVNLESDGKTVSRLEIKRSHSGNTEKASWWRATNKDFLKIFAAPGSRLAKISGNSQKTVNPPINYQKQNYQNDFDVQIIEKNQQFLEDFDVWLSEESGKTTWASWFNVSAGAAKTLKLEYETPGNIYSSVKPDKIYQFIFDKQSGVDGKLKVSIETPVGYKWQESQGYIYEYENENPPARLIINLTLLSI